MQRYFHWLNLIPQRAMRDACERAFFTSHPSDAVETLGTLESSPLKGLPELVAESALLFQGNTAAVFNSTADIAHLTTSANHSAEDTLLAERIYLHHLSAIRLGKMKPHIWRDLLARPDIARHSAIITKIEIEIAASYMNNGHEKEAIDYLVYLSLERVEQDRYTHTRYWTVTYLCNLALGRQEKAKEALSQLNPSGWRLSSTSMRLAHGRRTVDWHLSLGDCAEAERWWDKTNRLGCESHITRILLLKQLCTIQVRRNDFIAAAQTLRRVKIECRTRGLSPEFIDCFREECEILFATDGEAAVQKRVEQELSQSPQGMPPYRALLCRMFAAACHMSKKNHPMAFTALTEARSILKVHGYALESFEVTLLESACYRALGDVNRASQLLKRAAGEATTPLSLALPLRFLDELISTRGRVPATLLLRLAETPSCLEYLQRYLRFCSLNLSFRFRIEKTAAGREHVGVPELVHRVRELNASWWFEDDSLLVYVGNRHVRCEDFSRSPDMKALWGAFISQKEGLTLSGIHALRSTHPFRAPKHSAALGHVF